MEIWPSKFPLLKISHFMKFSIGEIPKGLNSAHENFNQGKCDRQDLQWRRQK